MLHGQIRIQSIVVYIMHLNIISYSMRYKNPSKHTKTKNSYFIPNMHVCNNNQVGRGGGLKFMKIIILLNSGFSSMIVTDNMESKINHKNVLKTVGKHRVVILLPLIEVKLISYH